jgi:hypothetical protein
MILRVLFIQRQDSYPGQHAPEAVEIADEYTDDDSPEFLQKKLKEQTGSDIENAQIIDIEVDQARIMSILRPQNPPIAGTIKEQNNGR